MEGGGGDVAAPWGLAGHSPWAQLFPQTSAAWRQTKRLAFVLGFSMHLSVCTHRTVALGEVDFELWLRCLIVVNAVFDHFFLFLVYFYYFRDEG